MVHDTTCVHDGHCLVSISFYAKQQGRRLVRRLSLTNASTEMNKSIRYRWDTVVPKDKQTCLACPLPTQPHIPSIYSQREVSTQQLQSRLQRWFSGQAAKAWWCSASPLSSLPHRQLMLKPLAEPMVRINANHLCKFLCTRTETSFIKPLYHGAIACRCWEEDEERVGGCGQRRWSNNIPHRPLPALLRAAACVNACASIKYICRI